MLVILLNPHPRALACPSTPKVLRAKERAPTPSPFVIFTFGFVVESIKDFGGVSLATLLGLPPSLKSLELCSFKFAHPIKEVVSLPHPSMMSSKALVATRVFITLVTLLGSLPSPFHLEIDNFEQGKDEGKGLQDCHNFW